MENIVFYFSGTGNSLHVAKCISKEIGDCEIMPMVKPFNSTKQYSSVGFIYPTYYWGMPKKVIEFIEDLKLNNSEDTYYYSIATYGGLAGNAVYQMYETLLNRHGIKINYGVKLKMFANYVVAYDMSANIDKITKKSNEKLTSIINSIKKRRRNKINKLTRIFKSMNEKFIKEVPTMDKDFTISGNCTGCGICGKICPVKNIEMANNRPEYKHHCEQCVACIQFCPQKAINYKNLTQNRKRYTNPEISFKELIEYNNK